MLTINQVKQYLISFFNNHLQINTVVYDSDFNFNAEDDILYKVVQIQPVDPVQVTYNEAVYKFKVVVADIINPENNDSESDIQSDSISIANDFISYFGDEDFQDFYLDKNISIQTFTEKNGDRIAGCVFAFGVRQTRLFNPCSIPLANPFTGVSFTGYIAESNPYYNLLASYLTIASASTLYQPKGNYLTGITTELSDYYTKEQANTLFLTGFTVNLSDYYTIEQANAKFLTGYTPDLSNYYTKSQTDGKYQLIGDYVSASTLNNYQLAGNYVSASTLANYQPVGNYVSASTLSNYQLEGNYVSASTLSNYLTSAQISAAYQPLGNYVSASTLGSYQLAGNYVSASTLANYQPLGNYVSASTLNNYLTAIQISAAYQAIGNYVSASTLTNYQLAGNYVSASTLSQYQLLLNISTSGSSGAATFDGINLNIPQYAGTTYTASNGISLTGSTFGLGGTLTQNTNTEMSGHTWKLIDTIGTDKFTIGNGSFWIIEGVSATTNSFLKVTPGAFNAATYIANTTDNFSFFCNPSSMSLTYAQNSSGTSKQFSISPTAIQIYDTVSLKGMTYSADYSTNGKTDNRWIPDWGAVKNYVSGITGTTVILSTSGSSGSATLNSGYLNIPTYTLAGLGGQTVITLTTSGTSGSATLNSGFLNIPNYTIVASANPTATIGLAAVNGTANTFMTSDSAPALSQSITPVWLSAHTYYLGQITGTTPTDAIILSNYNLSTSAITTQNSPSLTFSGSSWNGSSAITYNFKLKSVAVGGNGYGQFIIQGSLGNGSLSNWLIIDSFGAFITRNNFTNQVNGIAKTSTDSLIFQNTSNATVGTPVQYSGRMRMQGAGWNTTTGASNQVEFITEVRPVSGSTVGGNLFWSSRVSSGGSGSFTDVLSVSNTGTLTLQAPVVTKGYTVSTLPTGTQGMRAYVTDSTGTTFGAVVGGGGSNIIPVFYNGTNWIIC